MHVVSADEFLKARKKDEENGGGGGGSVRGGTRVGGGRALGLGGGAPAANEAGSRRARIVKLSYRTEYNDAYGKLGELIISSRLHARDNEDKDPKTCP